MGSDRYLPPWVWGREEVFKSDDRAGLIEAMPIRERSKSFRIIACNLVSMEMEASFKTNPQ